jgi:SynChlorMet cassette radical SAM/SPASM protein ScmE
MGLELMLSTLKCRDDSCIMPRSMQLTKPLELPIHLASILVTKRCNMSCLHCCTKSPINGPELSLSEIKQAILDLKKYGVFEIAITGGEPFLRDDIFEILKFAKKHGFYLIVTTNCTLIDDKVIKKLKRLSQVDMRVSLDGSTPEINDRIRGEGSFEKMMTGIKRLNDAGFILTGKTVVTRYNLDDLFNIADLAKKLKFKKMRFTTLLASGSAKKNLEDIGIREHDFPKVRRITKRLLEKYGSIAVGSLIEIYQRMEKLKNLRKKFPHSTQAGFIGKCSAGNSCVAVRSDGEVVPCTFLLDMPCGSLRKKSFGKIWESSPVLKHLRSSERPSLDTLAECKGCKYKAFCNGFCRAMSYNRNGLIDGFSTECSIFTGKMPLKK